MGYVLRHREEPLVVLFCERRWRGFAVSPTYRHNPWVTARLVPFPTREDAQRELDYLCSAATWVLVEYTPTGVVRWTTNGNHHSFWEIVEEALPLEPPSAS